jgi:DNA-binding MarR family transcriptional regulator
MRANEPKAYSASPTAKLIFISTLLAKPFMERIGPEHEITLPEWRTLIALDGQNVLSNTAISELTGLDAMTVSRALERLRRKGRVERSKDASDARVHRNKMTAQGRSTYRSILKLAWERQATMMAVLNAQQIEQLDQTLDKLVAQLKQLEAQGRQAALPTDPKTTA